MNAGNAWTMTGLVFRAVAPTLDAKCGLAGMGFTVLDLVRIALTKVAKEKALPFDMRVPNKLTSDTVAKSERGQDVHHAKDADDLFNQLGIQLGICCDRVGTLCARFEGLTRHNFPSHM